MLADNPRARELCHAPMCPPPSEDPVPTSTEARNMEMKGPMVMGGREIPPTGKSFESA
jgi:hypothetical protein